MSNSDPITPDGLLDGIRPRAVFRGFVWDNGLSILLGLGLGFVMLAGGVLESTDEEIDALFASARFNFLFLPVGIACTVLGGYIAGSRARAAPLKNALAVGIADIAIGALAYLIPTTGPPPPIWVDLAGFVLVVPAAAVGGVLARRSA